MDLIVVTMEGLAIATLVGDLNAIPSARKKYATLFSIQRFSGCDVPIPVLSSSLQEFEALALFRN